jgi:hypothetical protein
MLLWFTPEMVFAQLLNLDQQERDARRRLLQPQSKPGMRKQIRRLLVRLSQDWRNWNGPWLSK